MYGIPSAPYSPYKILETDYTSYALVYSCISIIFVKIEFAWILVRNTTTGENRTRIDDFKAVYSRNGIDPSEFFEVVQDCENATSNTYVLDGNGERRDRASGRAMEVDSVNGDGQHAASVPAVAQHRIDQWPRDYKHLHARKRPGVGSN